MKEPASERSLVFSYLALRKAIGVLGIALPCVVSLGAWIFFQTSLRGSISGYYYTGTRDVLVGTLCTIGFFLLSYRGYTRADDIAGDVACVSAVCIALFPTTPELNPSTQAQWIGYIHFTFAAIFFLTLIYFSLCLFTKTDPSRPPTRRKLQRNRVYKGCGYAIAICISLIAIYHILPTGMATPVKQLNPVFWLETIANMAFGISWLTKGEALLKDERPSRENRDGLIRAKPSVRGVTR